MLRHLLSSSDKDMLTPCTYLLICDIYSPDFFWETESIFQWVDWSRERSHNMELELVHFEAERADRDLSYLIYLSLLRVRRELIYQRNRTLREPWTLLIYTPDKDIGSTESSDRHANFSNRKISEHGFGLVYFGTSPEKKNRHHEVMVCFFKADQTWHCFHESWNVC